MVRHDIVHRHPSRNHGTTAGAPLQLSLFDVGAASGPVVDVEPPPAGLDVLFDADDGEDDDHAEESFDGGPSRMRLVQSRVAEGAGAKVRVVITDNRHTLLSWRRSDDEAAPFIVRMHHMFLDAPDDVARAVGRWMADPRRAPSDALIDSYMAQNRHLVTRERRPLQSPSGRVHDLQGIFDALNREHFEGHVQATIGWGEPGSPRRRRRRTIQLGCFDPESRVIAIHPALDQRFVPRFFVQSVVFHEMLHERIPATEDGDRRCVHTPEFKRREEAYELTGPARAWQNAHLNRLLAWRPESSKGTAAPLLKTARRTRR